MNAPLISVIVPIYNVEKYIRKCLESLINQSMKQIEVICIDDGSTDESGRIADEYCNIDAEGNKKVWPVIKVIHTANRGLSAARNRGIDEVQAEWLMFVDSDDWVEREFCVRPWKVAVRENADLVAFQAYTVKHGKVKKPKSPNIKVGIVDEMIAYDYVGTAAWNKLYKKELLEDIRYPEGRVYEDIATTHKIIHRAKRIYLLNDYLYYHIKWKGSITQTHSLSNKRDRLLASIERQKDLLTR